MKTIKNTLIKKVNLWQIEFDYSPYPGQTFQNIYRYDFTTTNDYNNINKTLYTFKNIIPNGYIPDSGSSIEAKTIEAIKSQIISNMENDPNKMFSNIRVVYDKNIEVQERVLSEFIIPYGYIEYLTIYQSEMIPEWWNTEDLNNNKNI